MDFKQNISLSFEFSTQNFEYQFPLPSNDEGFLEDVEFSIFSYPVLRSGPGSGGRASVNDLHIYLGDQDFTSAFREILKELLDSSDQNILLAQYKKALDSWIDMATKLEPRYSGNLGFDKAQRVLLLQAAPLSSLLTKLGDKSAGSTGVLHIFNFLYRNIKIPAVKLIDLINKFNELNGANLDLSTVNTEVLTFSTGPSRFFSNDWPHHEENVGGAVSCFITLRYHNPNDDAIENLGNRLTELELTNTDHETRIGDLEEELNNKLEEIIDQLDEIYELLEDEGVIFKKISSMEDAITEVKKSLNLAQSSFKSHQELLVSIEKRLDDLKIINSQ